MKTLLEIQGGARDGLRVTYNGSDLVISADSSLATGRTPKPTGNPERVEVVTMPQLYQTPIKTGETQ